MTEDRPILAAAESDLAIELERAVRRAEDPDARWRALAALAPADALGGLLRSVDSDGAEPPSADLLRRIVDEALARAGDEVPGEVWLEFLERFGDRLSEAAAGRVLSALLDRPSAPPERLARAADAAFEREPDDPLLLRAGARLAIEAGEASRAHRLLDRLGRADPTPGTMQWIHRRRSRIAPASERVIRVAMLGSFTVDSLHHYVDFEVRQLGLEPRIHVAAFNSWAPEIIAEDSELHRFGPDIAFLAVSVDDLVPGLAGPMTADDLEREGDAVVETLAGLAARFRERSKALLVAHGLHSAFRDPAGPAAGRGAPDRSRWLSELNARLSDALAEIPRSYLLDVEDTLLRRERGPADDARLRHLAGMRLAGPALAEIALAYAGYIAPLAGLTRKCVVLDLDNTLWGGIVGEDGPEGIRLGPTAPGSEYVEFQRYLSTLGERGILLAICSKNNPEDALQVLREHDAMVLREDAFSAVRINWKPKPENLLEIAGELNIGVDSLVFVDDNPHERELMRQALPEVLTPELPADPSRYRRTIERLPQLQSLVVTEVDRSRVEQYRAKRDRDRLRSVTASLERYHRSLEIRVEIARATASTLPRIHQLFQRTNQFNLTTRRYDAAELEAFSRDPDWVLYGLRARDRFGDHGLVAAALVEDGGTGRRIDSFLMSCRVISYGVETALLHVIVGEATGAGAEVVTGEFIETAKNKPAADFYERHGFVASGEGPGGVRRWRLELPDGRVDPPSWIELEFGA